MGRLQWRASGAGFGAHLAPRLGRTYNRAAVRQQTVGLGGRQAAPLGLWQPASPQAGAWQPDRLHGDRGIGCCCSGTPIEAVQTRQPAWEIHVDACGAKTRFRRLLRPLAARISQLAPPATQLPTRPAQQHPSACSRSWRRPQSPRPWRQFRPTTSWWPPAQTPCWGGRPSSRRRLRPISARCGPRSRRLGWQGGRVGRQQALASPPALNRRHPPDSPALGPALAWLDSQPARVLIGAAGQAMG